jgi:hypothetical protein
MMGMYCQWYIMIFVTPTPSLPVSPLKLSQRLAIRFKMAAMLACKVAAEFMKMGGAHREPTDWPDIYTIFPDV